MVADFTWLGRACLVSLGCGALEGGWQWCSAVLQSAAAPPQRAGAAMWAAANPRGSSLGHPDSEGLFENVCRSFHGPAKLVVGFLSCRGSCRGLEVLGSCSAGVQHPLKAVAARWATSNPRGSSPRQPNSEGLSNNVGRSFHGPAKLILAFLG